MAQFIWEFRELRMRKGWSQRQLATIADVSVSTISALENGRSVSELSMVRLRKALMGSDDDQNLAGGLLFSSNEDNEFIRVSESTLSEIVSAQRNYRYSNSYLANLAGISRSTLRHSMKSGMFRRSILRKILATMDIDAQYTNIKQRPELATESVADQASSLIRERVARVARSIPNQDPLFKFGLTSNYRVSSCPSEAGPNDVRVISALRDEILGRAPSGGVACR